VQGAALYPKATTAKPMTNPKDLSDIFGRFFVVAGYLPALALLTLVRWLILPGLPAGIQDQLSVINDTAYIKEFTVLVLIPVFLAAILVSLTNTTVQLYAGRSIFRPDKPRIAKLKEFGNLVKEIETRVELLQIIDPNADAELKDRINKAPADLKLLIPELRKITGGVILFKSSALHTTRLGNVLASLNEYPDRRYGMNAGTIWPRLKTILPAPFEERLKSQNTSFMFMLNLSACCLIFSLAWILFGAASLAGYSQVSTSSWVIIFISVYACAYLFYRASVSEASILVETMTTAFDIYRDLLLKELGFDLPANIQDEKRLWGTLTIFLLLGDERFVPSKVKDFPASPPNKQQFSLWKFFDNLLSSK
jgi:hypothetical protein